MQSDILTDKSDIDMSVLAVNFIQHAIPFTQINGTWIQVKFTADNGRKVLFFQHDRCLIQVIDCNVFNNAVFLDITEQRNLLFDIFR